MFGSHAAKQRVPVHIDLWMVLMLTPLGIVPVAWGSSPAVLPSRPNFLLIMADDMGYSDAGCYGGEIATPHLDKLATGGLRFTQFYNTARCWPTRAALLTGYYPQQTRRDQMPGVDPRRFGGRGVRPAWAKLVSSHLHDLGYRCYHSGKWHIDGTPLDNGFDRTSQFAKGPGFFMRPARRGAEKQAEDDVTNYLTIATAQVAIDELKQHAAEHPDQPFFQYLAFNAPHFPLHALPADIERYRDRYVAGWEELREARHARQQELGISNGALSALEPELGPPYDFPESLATLGPDEVNRPLPWQKLTDSQKRFQATKMAIHAAMIDRMDREIGRVLDQLKVMDALDHTVVFFLSDNGASAEIMVRGDGHDPAAPMGSATTYLCLGPGFSSAANTPFRRHKTWVHEGGISTPLIVHWPDGIQAKNELRQTPAHVIDIAPTILELAGVNEQQADGPPVPGRSLVKVFSGDEGPVHEIIWFYHEGNRALRKGDWKVIHANGTRTFPWRDQEPANVTDGWALYDLASDRAEQLDLADQYPERVQSMVQLWHQYRDQFARQAGVPLPETAAMRHD